MHGTAPASHKEIEVKLEVAGYPINSQEDSAFSDHQDCAQTRIPNLGLF